MNAHTNIPSMPVPTKEISLLEVEDAMNTAHTASTMVHDYLENFLCGFVHTRHRQDANAASYAINHLLDVVHAAHDEFHRYMQQEFQRDRERKLAYGEPDPEVCPSWKGAGIYRFHSFPHGQFYSVSWSRDLGWFNLVVPATGERFMALCAEMFEQNVSAIVSDPSQINSAMAA